MNEIINNNQLNDSLHEIQHTINEINNSFALKELLKTSEEIKKNLDSSIDSADRVRRTAKTLRHELQETESITQGITEKLRKGFYDITRSFGDNFLNLLSGESGGFKRKLSRTIDNTDYAIKNDMLRSIFLGDFGKRNELGHKLGGILGDIMGPSKGRTLFEDSVASGDIFSVLSELLSPRAGGGNVAAKRPFLVGERGPEMFIPNQSGNIVPNHKLKAYGSEQKIVINMNINTNDAASFKRSEQQIASNLQRFLAKGHRG